MTAAAQLLDAIVPLVRGRLPAGVTVAYLDDFLGRNRFALEAVIEQNLGPILRRMEAANRPFGDEDIPELWTASKRTAANIAAMVVASRIYADRRIPSADERAVLAGYSGWGGLSIQAAAGKFPPGFPVPEERGLIHEFYTPTKVTREVARVVAPLVDSLPMDGASVHALEPSAGIGRFLHAFANVPGLTWHAVEWSELSARMLKALRPDLDLTNAPFERWVREKGAGAAGRLGLVVSNPPYGIRGASIAEDPERAYREKMASVLNIAICPNKPGTTVPLGPPGASSSGRLRPVVISSLHRGCTVVYRRPPVPWTSGIDDAVAVRNRRQPPGCLNGPRQPLRGIRGRPRRAPRAEQRAALRGASATSWRSPAAAMPVDLQGFL
jgi:hypothetical protein